MASSLKPSAGRSALDLVDALAAAGWGPIAGADWRASRVLLETLARLMWKAKTDRRGQLTITARQLSDRSGYGDRWTRTHLSVLEDTGVLQWERGGIKDGRPQPGYMRIVKSVLCEWIEVARQAHDEALRQRALEFTARLRTLKFLTIRPKSRRKPLAAVNTTLPPYRGRKAGSPRQPDPPNSLKEDKMLPPAVIDHLPQICIHGAKSPLTCNRCRYRAITDAQDAAKARPPEQPQLPVSPDPDPEIQAMFDYMTAAHPDLSPNTRTWRKQLLRDSLDGLLQAWKEAREEALV